MRLSAIIAGYIREAGLQAVIFSGAEPNPTDVNVHDGVKLYQKEGCDFIVSLGGGTVSITHPEVHPADPKPTANKIVNSYSVEG
jgi:hypothetical protein